MRHTPRHFDWRVHFRAEASNAELVLAKIADKVFTLWSFLAHIVVYPLAMYLEGGDFHLFLDAISIEAVAVGLCVGINTKLQLKGEHVAQLHRDHMQECIEASVESDKALTEAVHTLTEEIHKRVVVRAAAEAGLTASAPRDMTQQHTSTEGERHGGCEEPAHGKPEADAEKT